MKSGYETKDISFGALVALTGVLLIILGGAIGVTYVLHAYLMRTAMMPGRPHSALAELHRVPPEPRLQVDPAVDLIRLRDVENDRLTNYTWIDLEAGKVRIPIT